MQNSDLQGEQTSSGKTLFRANLFIKNFKWIKNICNYLLWILSIVLTLFSQLEFLSSTAVRKNISF
jgi:hypothetical protein